MPGEIIEEPNPPPLPSELPDYVNDLCVKIDKISLDKSVADAIYKFRRAADYIAAGKGV
jgi:xylulose-5-phosphate/fructose-6-phosphate phosphoketolase